MLRGFGGLAALGSAAAIAAWITIGGFGPDLTEALDTGESIAANDSVEPASAAAEEQQTPATNAIPDAAIVVASLLSPYPMVASATPMQAFAMSAPAADETQVTGSIRTAAESVDRQVTAAIQSTPAAVPAPVVKKALVVPRLERDGTLNIAQIAHIKATLNLSPDQERYWMPVEAQLRELARQRIAQKASGRKPTLALGAADAQRLYWAAGPLIMSLREDQKRDVRRLARAMGLEQVASLI